MSNYQAYLVDLLEKAAAGVRVDFSSLDLAAIVKFLKTSRAIIDKLPKDINGDFVVPGEKYHRPNSDYVYEAELAGADGDCYSPTTLNWNEYRPWKEE